MFVYNSTTWTKLQLLSSQAPVGTTKVVIALYSGGGPGGTISLFDNLYATKARRWTDHAIVRPTELADGRVANGLTSTGQVQAGRVVTASVADNQITKTSVTAMVSNATVSNGAGWTNIMSATITTPAAAAILLDTFVKVSAGAAGSFSSKAKPSIRLRDGGGNILQTYALAYTYDETILVLKAAATLNGTGTYYVDIDEPSTWADVTCSGGVLTVAALMK